MRAQRINLCQLIYGSIFAKNSDIKRYRRFRWVNKDIGDHNFLVLKLLNINNNQQPEELRFQNFTSVSESWRRPRESPASSGIIIAIVFGSTTLDVSWCALVYSLTIYFLKSFYHKSLDLLFLIYSIFANLSYCWHELCGTMWNYSFLPLPKQRERLY